MNDDPAPNPFTPPAPTVKQRVAKAAPFLPYLPLAIGMKTRSANWLIVAVFTQLAVKPPKRIVTVTDSTFSATGDAPMLVIK